MSNIEILYGYCHCGCGEKTSIAKMTSARRGQKKGEPVKYIHNHHGKGITKQYCKYGHERNVDSTGHCIPCKIEYNKIYNKQYNEDNLEKVKAYRLANVESKKIYDEVYAANNRDKMRVKSTNQRARTFNAFVCDVIPTEIYKRDNYICQICGKPLDMNSKWPDSLYPTLDHIIPFTKGGTHEHSNVQAAHLGCNISKSNRIL